MYFVPKVSVKSIIIIKKNFDNHLKVYPLPTFLVYFFFFLNGRGKIFINLIFLWIQNLQAEKCKL